jgi:hypothetical protein
MVTKLTLSAEEGVVRQAKRLAKERKTSVSAMFERFVLSAAGGQPVERPIGRLTRKATRVLSVRGKKSERELVEEALLEKYGLK